MRLSQARGDMILKARLRTPKVKKLPNTTMGSEEHQLGRAAAAKRCYKGLGRKRHRVLKRNTWGCPETRGTFSGVPRIRTIVFGGLYWGPPISGNYHVAFPTMDSHFTHLRLLWASLTLCSC